MRTLALIQNEQFRARIAGKECRHFNEVGRIVHYTPRGGRRRFFTKRDVCRTRPETSSEKFAR